LARIIRTSPRSIPAAKRCDALVLNALLLGLRLVVLVLSGHKQVAFENAALRQQLVILKRDVKRPRLSRWDRLFWTGLMTI